MVRLLVDTCCDLFEEDKKNKNLDIVSLNVIIDGKSYRDQKEIKTQDIVELMFEGTMPGTSQVLPGDFKTYFEEQAEAGNEVVYLSFSGALSGTYQTARMILDQVQEEYPDFKAYIVDSKQSGGPIGLMAHELLELIDEGADAKELSSAALALRDHAFYLFTMQNLKWLSKGGRLGKVTATLGDMLKIRPVILVKDGVMDVIGKVRGDKKAMSILKDKFVSMICGYKDQIVGVGIADEKTCRPLTERTVAFLKEIGIKGYEIAQIGTVLAAHLGTTGTGVFFWDQNPKEIMKESGITAGGELLSYA